MDALTEPARSIQRTGTGHGQVMRRGLLAAQGQQAMRQGPQVARRRGMSQGLHAAHQIGSSSSLTCSRPGHRCRYLVVGKLSCGPARPVHMQATGSTA